MFGEKFVTEVKATKSAKKTSLELKANPYIKPSIPSVSKIQRNQPEKSNRQQLQDRRNLGKLQMSADKRGNEISTIEEVLERQGQQETTHTFK